MFFKYNNVYRIDLLNIFIHLAWKNNNDDLCETFTSRLIWDTINAWHAEEDLYLTAHFYERLVTAASAARAVYYTVHN